MRGQFVFRENNHKNASIGWGHLNIFSRTTEPDELWPQCHKSFEHSQEKSQFKYPSPTIGELRIFSVYILKSENIIKVKDICNSAIL
jgi:hypothetical protein